MNEYTNNDIATQKEQLKAQLTKLVEQEQKEKFEKDLEANYQAFKDRPSVFLLGKGYCSPITTKYSDALTGLRSLGITVTIPGNSSYTYRVTSEVTSAVVTYFHNVITDSIRNELQQKINKVIEETIEKVVGTPQCVLEMLGLQSEDYFLDQTVHYPKDRIDEIKKEILEERFKVVDKFAEQELISVVGRLSHSTHLLKLYAQNRKLESLLKRLCI
jgi:hypothetical protein